MATAQQFVAIAVAENGYVETGNNNTKYGEWFGLNNEPWCAVFVSWCASKAGIPESGLARAASAGDFIYQAKTNGKGAYHAKGSGYTPKIGDLFIVDYRGGSSAQHVGIVASIGSGATFTSIEGNSSDKVCQRIRNFSDFDYVTPLFSDKSADTTTLKPQRERVVEVPEGLGKLYTYETWNREEHGYTKWIGNQKKLIELCEQRGEQRYDADGYGYVGNRYAVAMTNTFGNIGDYVDIYCVDGRVIHAILGDEKHTGKPVAYDPNPANKWGHLNGQVVVEFMTNWPATPVHQNPPGNGGVTKVINLGNYFEYPEYARGGEAGGIGESGKVEITSSRIVNEVGGRGTARVNPLEDKNTIGGYVELYIINHDGKVAFPAVAGDITLELCRKGAPGKLTFTVIKSPELDFQEGAQVILKRKGFEMFYGFVFEKSRSKGEIIKVTAYDQLRYFKNKDCYVYENKTADELIKMIAEDHNLVCGELQNTGYKIPLRVEDNSTLFDIIQNAFDITLYNTGEMFVLYDDFGKLTVKKPKDWLFDVVIDDETAQDLDYTTSINEDVATRIKLYYDNKQTGEREIYIYNNEELIDKWGVLQMCESVEEGEDGIAKAKLMSALYAAKNRTLTIKDAFGVPDIRAGCCVYIKLPLGDTEINNFMLVENVKHKISDSKHTMDLTLFGGEFTA